MGGSASMGYGKSDSSSYGENVSDSYGYNTSAGANQASSAQNVWGAQEPALSGLYAQAAGLTGGTSPYGQQASMIGQQGQAAWQNQLSPGGNPYFDQAVQASIDQATESFKRQVLPELESRGVEAGAYGSSRDALARGEAAGVFGAGLGQTVAQQRAAQYTADQNRAVQALGMTPLMQSAAFAPLTMARELVGGPTVLGQSQSSGWQQALGEQMSHSEGFQQSRSKARDYKMSAGGGVKGG